jgi:hypothetical protein
MPWGTALLAVGSIASGVIGSDASKSAASQQAQAAQNATNAELSMYNQTVQREQPFLTAGTNALGSLQNLLGLNGGGSGSSPILQMLGIGAGGATGGGINPSTFQGSPGYQYQLQQGMNAVTNANAPNPGGNALRQLQQTGQGLANQNWNQYLGNASGAWQQLLGGVGSLVGIGQNAAGNLGNAAQAVGGQIGSNAIGAGNASALAGGANGAINNSLAYLLNNQGGGGTNPITGIGNLLSGYNYNGMAGGSMLSGLSDQAASNVAAGGPY